MGGGPWWDIVVVASSIDPAKDFGYFGRAVAA